MPGYKQPPVPKHLNYYLSDRQIVAVYRWWSEYFYSAGWLTSGYERFAEAMDDLAATGREFEAREHDLIETFRTATGYPTWRAAVLDWLRRNGPGTAQRIARDTGCTRGTAYTTLNRAHRAGLVRKVRYAVWAIKE